MIPDMTIVSVLYPRHSESRFDHEYYLQKHMPLLQQRWAGMGLVKMEWMRGVAAPDGGEPGYEVITLLSFVSRRRSRLHSQPLATRSSETFPASRM